MEAGKKRQEKNGRSLTHERILFILFTMPQRTLLSFREISAFFCSFSIDFTFHFNFVTLLSFGIMLVSICVKTLLLISIALMQIFTPFHVRDDTVLHFKLPLSRTPLIYMLLSFHLSFFQVFIHSSPVYM